VRIIGATSHYGTEGVDEGPIIEQEATRVPHRSAFERFLELGHVLEAKVLYRAVRWHLEHRVLVYGGKTVVFDAAHDDEREPGLPIRMPAPRRAMAAA
jgi:formyltetrahydrofolate deformylase